MTTQELALYETLLSKLKSEPLSYAKNQKGQPTFNHVKSDLIFDEDRNEVTWQNQTTSLAQQPIVKRMIKLLLQNPNGVSKELLVREVWGFDYHPLPMIQ